MIDLCYCVQANVMFVNVATTSLFGRRIPPLLHTKLTCLVFPTLSAYFQNHILLQDSMASHVQNASGKSNVVSCFVKQCKAQTCTCICVTGLQAVQHPLFEQNTTGWTMFSGQVIPVARTSYYVATSSSGTVSASQQGSFRLCRRKCFLMR